MTCTGSRRQKHENAQRRCNTHERQDRGAKQQAAQFSDKVFALEISLVDRPTNGFVKRGHVDARAHIENVFCEHDDSPLFCFLFGENVEGWLNDHIVLFAWCLDVDELLQLTWRPFVVRFSQSWINAASRPSTSGTWSDRNRLPTFGARSFLVLFALVFGCALFSAVFLGVVFCLELTKNLSLVAWLSPHLRSQTCDSSFDRPEAAAKQARLLSRTVAHRSLRRARAGRLLCESVTFCLVSPLLARVSLATASLPIFFCVSYWALRMERENVLVRGNNTFWYQTPVSLKRDGDIFVAQRVANDNANV